MKFLASVSADQAREIEERFRAKGIPVYLEADLVRENESKNVPATVVRTFNEPANWYRINVCFDEQFDDALHLLENPNYEVTAPVDVAEFERTMKRLGANRQARIPDNFLNWTIGGFLLLVMLVIAAVAVTHKS